MSRDIGGSLYIHCYLTFFIIHDLALESSYRFIHHLAVKLIANVHHVAALLGSEHVARAPYLKVTHGDLKS